MIEAVEREASPRTSGAVAPSWWRRLLGNEDLNFLLTNRLPRRFATKLMGVVSRIPTGPMTRASIAVWKRLDAKS